MLPNYALLSYSNPSEKVYCPREAGRKVSKRKFPISGEHSGVTSNNNCSAIPRGEKGIENISSGDDGQRPSIARI